MRTFANQATLTSLENAAVRQAWLKVESSDELLRFGLHASASPGDMDTAVCQSAFINGTTGILAGRAGSAAYLTPTNYSAGTGLHVGSTNASRVIVQYGAVNVAAMRGSFDANGDFYTALWMWNSQPAIYKGTLSGGSISWSTYNSSLVGPVMQQSVDLVRRVDAVLYTTLGVIAVFGSYNGEAGVYTQSFYLVKPGSGSIVKLDTIIQRKAPEGTKLAAWYAVERWGSFAAAKANGDTITVVANDGVRAVKFHITNGIESQLEPITDIDFSSATHKFYAASIEKIGSLYYMTGRMTRSMTDGTSQVLEMYFTSEDMVNWSVGEYSSFITQTASHLVLPAMASFTPAHIYAIGGGNLFRAAARVMDTGGALTDISSKVLSASINAGTNAADSASVATHHYQAIAETSPGRVLDISAGLKNGSGTEYGGKLGRYVIDVQPEVINAAGRNAVQVDAIDQASWKLINWKANTDIDRWSWTRMEPDLSSAGMIIKTPQREIKFGSTGFVSTALNNPFVGYSAARDSRDGIARMTVNFGSASSASLSSVGFVVGASASEFNALLIPRNNSVTNRPAFRRSNLPASDDEGNGGWNTEDHVSGLMTSWLTNAYAKITKHPNALASGSDEEYYSGAVFSAGTDYLLTLRVQGRRVQLYARTKDLNAATQVSSSQQSLVYEWLANEYAPLRHSPQSYWGFVAGTDVWCRKDNEFAVETGLGRGLTSAWQPGNIPAEIEYHFGKNLLAGSTSTNGSGGVNIPSGYSGSFNAGQTVRVQVPGYSDQLRTVKSVSSTVVTFYDYRTTSDANFGAPGGTTCYLYGMSDGDGVTGELDSGYGKKYDSINNVVTYDFGAAKKPTRMYGRATIVSDTTTALFSRPAYSDGEYHSLLSGSFSNGGTWEAFDTTSPLASPYSWRIYMRSSRFFAGAPSQYGLPTYGYFKVGDEIVRYVSYTFKKRGSWPGGGSTETWTVCPVYIAPLAKAGGPALKLNQWKSYGNAKPGDYFEHIGTAANTDPYTPAVSPSGLLVEIENRDSKPDDYSKSSTNYYVSSINGTTGEITLDKHYPNSINGSYVDIDKPGVTQAEKDLASGGELAIISGFAQMGTSPELHSTSQPVVFYPTTDTNPISSLVNVKKFAALAGLYNSAEDDLKYICNLAGVRGVQFRSLGSYSGVLGTTLQTLSTSETDFVLDLNAHLYAATDNRLRVRFRGNYLLDIRATGLKGVIRLQLAAPNMAITQGAADQKWVDQVDVSVSEIPISGTVSAGVFTENAAMLHRVRVVVRKNTVAVEVDRQLAWQFDLSDYAADGGYYKTAGPVTIQYTSSQSQSITARLVELSDDVENHIIDMGTPGGEALSFVRQERHILSRSTQDGGLEFSRYLSRDQEATLTENLVSVQPKLAALEAVGHVNISGVEFGEWVDESWIQQNGYKFDMGGNRLLDTVSDSTREARTLVRGMKESSKVLAIQGVARLAMQPEGKATVVFSSSGDAPSFPSEDFVISSVSFQIAPQHGAFAGSYELRKYYAF